MILTTIVSGNGISDSGFGNTEPEMFTRGMPTGDVVFDRDIDSGDFEMALSFVCPFAYASYYGDVGMEHTTNLLPCSAILARLVIV